MYSLLDIFKLDPTRSPRHPPNMKLADTLLQFIPYNPLPRYLTEYQPGITPLSDTTPVVATLIAYLLTIFSIRWFMQDKAPLNLTSFFQSHNLFLAAISSLLLVLIAEEILPIWWRTGFFSAICHLRSWTEVPCPWVHFRSHRSCSRASF